MVVVYVGNDSDKADKKVLGNVMYIKFINWVKIGKVN